MKKSIIIKSCIIPFIIAIDMITKFAFDGKSFNLIPKVLSVFSHYNTGAAWGIFGGKLWFLIIVSVLFLALIVMFDIFFKNSHLLYNMGISFIIGGAVGNMIDRIFLGHVRDFIQLDFMNFPIFNLADSFLVIGVILIAVYVLFFYREKKDKKEKDAK